MSKKEQDKNPWLAFLFSALLPGAGLVYLGQKQWGLVNLLVVLMLGFGAAFTLSDEAYEKHFQLIAMTCAYGSAGGAYGLGMQMRRKAAAAKTLSD